MNRKDFKETADELDLKIINNLPKETKKREFQDRRGAR